MEEQLDVLIIGAGPIGLAAGIEAQKQGLRYCIIEKGVLVNSLYHYPLNMTFFSTSDKLEIGGVPFVSHNAKPTRAEAVEYYRRVAMHFKLKVHLYEGLESVNLKADQTIEVSTSKAVYQSKNLVLATGFYDEVNKLGVPGEERNKVHHYYQDPHPYFRQKVAVIGGRNSAVDAALETWRKGAEEVSMIVRNKTISERVKYWARPDILNRIEEGSIQAFFETEVKAIEADHLILEQNGRRFKLANDFVLALTGYHPNFDLLRRIGIHLKEDQAMIPDYHPETMESNVSGVYLAGVICGGLETQKWFIENSREHAEIIMKHIAQKTNLHAQASSD